MNDQENQSECLNAQGSSDDCSELYNCCDCGTGGCGCRYCFSCNACENCLADEDILSMKNSPIPKPIRGLVMTIGLLLLIAVLLPAYVVSLAWSIPRGRAGEATREVADAFNQIWEGCDYFIKTGCQSKFK